MQNSLKRCREKALKIKTLQLLNNKSLIFLKNTHGTIPYTAL